MRRLLLSIFALLFLVAADSDGCRAPWNPPPPSEVREVPVPKSPDLDYKVNGKRVSAWIELLQDLDSGERKGAAYQLGQAGERAWVAVPHLIHAMNEDQDVGVRLLAAEALGKVGPAVREVIPALEHAFRNDPATQVRVAASKALARIGVVPEAEDA